MIAITFYNKARFLDEVARLAERWDWSKPMAAKFDEMKRKEIQSAKFHAMCGDISKQKEWAGEMRTKSQWKHLPVSGHSIATNEDVEFVTGLEGEMLNIRESTASMTIKRMASLIEYTQAWASADGVRFTASLSYEDYPEATSRRRMIEEHQSKDSYL